jgi:hypothetical protein
VFWLTSRLWNVNVFPRKSCPSPYFRVRTFFFTVTVAPRPNMQGRWQRVQVPARLQRRSRAGVSPASCSIATTERLSKGTNEYSKETPVRKRQCSARPFVKRIKSFQRCQGGGWKGEKTSYSLLLACFPPSALHLPPFEKLHTHCSNENGIAALVNCLFPTFSIQSLTTSRAPPRLPCSISNADVLRLSKLSQPYIW